MVLFPVRDHNQPSSHQNCRRLYIDDFNATIQHIEGSKKVLADCLSRLPRMEKPSVGDRELQQKGRLIHFNQLAVPNNEVVDQSDAFT